MNAEEKSALALRLFKKLHDYMSDNAKMNEKYSDSGEDDPMAQSWRAAQQKVMEYWNIYLYSTTGNAKSDRERE